jgi:hypothetical protein
MTELTYPTLSAEYINWCRQYPAQLNEHNQTFGQYMKSKYDVSIVEEDTGLDTTQVSSPDVAFYLIYRNKFSIF